MHLLQGSERFSVAVGQLTDEPRDATPPDRNLKRHRDRCNNDLLLIESSTTPHFHNSPSYNKKKGEKMAVNGVCWHLSHQYQYEQ